MESDIVPRSEEQNRRGVCQRISGAIYGPQIKVDLHAIT